MKKAVRSLSLVLAVVLLAGCGKLQEKEVIKTCKLTQNQLTEGYKLDSVYTIYGKGKVVEKVETVETVTSDDEDVLDYFDEYLNSTYESINNTYGGYTIDINKDSGKVVSKVTIDYSKMNLTQYATDNSAIKNYLTKDNKLLIEGIQATYEALGAICE